MDRTGHFAISALIVGAIVGAAIGFGTAAAVDYMDDGQIFNGSVNAGQYIGTTLLGGTVGALGGAALTGTSMMLSGIAGGAAGSYVNASFAQLANRNINLGAMYTQTISGGVMGALGSMNLSFGVAAAKMGVAGISSGLVSMMYGKSISDSLMDGLHGAVYSGFASLGLMAGHRIGLIGNSSNSITKYETSFLARYISWIINNL